MKRILPVVAGLAAIVATCTGCGLHKASSDAGASVEAVKSAANKVLSSLDKTIASYSATDRGLYLTGVRDGMPSSFQDVSDQALLRVGASVCLLLDRGTSMMQIADRMIALDKQLGASDAVGSAIVSSAVVNLCPSHMSQLPGQ